MYEKYKTQMQNKQSRAIFSGQHEIIEIIIVITIAIIVVLLMTLSPVSFPIQMSYDVEVFGEKIQNQMT